MEVCLLHQYYTPAQRRIQFRGNNPNNPQTIFDKKKQHRETHKIASSLLLPRSEIPLVNAFLATGKTSKIGKNTLSANNIIIRMLDRSFKRPVFSPQSMSKPFLVLNFYFPCDRASGNETKILWNRKEKSIDTHTYVSVFSAMALYHRRIHAHHTQPTHPESCSARAFLGLLFPANFVSVFRISFYQPCGSKLFHFTSPLLACMFLAATVFWGASHRFICCCWLLPLLLLELSYLL